MARSTQPTPGALNSSRLARNRTGRSELAADQGQRDHVEVAAVVGGDHHAAHRGTLFTPRMSKRA